MNKKRRCQNRMSAYKAGILLVLLVEQVPSIRLCDITKLLSFMFSKEVRKASIINTIYDLNGCGILDVHKIDVIPKTVSNDKNPNRYEKIINEKYEDPEIRNKLLEMVGETKKQHNFGPGKYEIYVRLNKKLSPGFIAKKKNEIAGFFGFKNWFGGIVKPDGTRSTYHRIMKSYPQLTRSRNHAEELPERSFGQQGVVQTDMSRYQNPDEGRRGTEEL